MWTRGRTRLCFVTEPHLTEPTPLLPVPPQLLGAGHTLSAADVARMAALQATHGQQWVTAVVSQVATEQGPHVHFEAFQVSDQCTQLCADGWFVPSDNPKVRRTHMPKF